MTPDLIANSLASSLGLKDHINAVIFVWLGFLFVMTYYQSSTIERLEQQMTELVRKVALEKQSLLDLEATIDEKKNQLNSTKSKETSKSKPKTLAGE